MESLITSQGGLIAVISLCVAASFWSQKIKIFKFLGPALPGIILGIILSNTGIMPFWDEVGVYDVLFEYCVPLSLTMMLLNVNIKEWIKLSKQPLLAMLIAIMSVSTVAVVASIFLVPLISEGWKLAGMYVGTYTGGGSNLTAIGVGLNASPEIFGIANAGDYVVGIPVMLLFVAIPGILKKWKGLDRFWPHSLAPDELEGEDKTELFESKDWGVRDITALLAIGFTIVFLATSLSSALPPLFASAVRIILITTFALAIAQITPIRKIEGNIDLGYVFAMFFLVAIGLSIDIKGFFSDATYVILLAGTILFGGMILHLIICRLFKIKYQYVLAALVASIVDGTYSAIVVGSAGWKKLIPTAIVLGAMGNALGNYLGLGISFLIKAIIGA